MVYTINSGALKDILVGDGVIFVPGYLPPGVTPEDLCIVQNVSRPDILIVAVDLNGSGHPTNIDISPNIISTVWRQF